MQHHRSVLLRVSIIGCGHVGLVTGGCLATIGHQVICVDRDVERVRLLAGGHLHVYEGRLNELIQRSLSGGTITFKSDLGGTRDAEAVFLCIGVPQLDNGEADFSALDSAVRQIAQAVEPPKLVVERSTVPVQTGKQVKHLLSVYSQNREARFRVAANPSLLREGTAIEEFLHPDRILLGVEDVESEHILRQIYAPIVQRNFPCPIHSQGCPPRKPPELLFTNVHSAELIKHVSNAFLAVKISYANVLSDLCERIGADVQEVTHAIGLDSRIGKRFLDAGIGFGGSRLPNDLRALCRLLERVGVDAGIFKAAEDVNGNRTDAFFDKVQRALWVLKGKRIGILGLAHKPNTDDVRHSPAIKLCTRLIDAGAQIRAHDPQAMPNALNIHPDIMSSRDAYEAAERADAVLILTDWEQFRTLDWQRIRELMIRPLLLDGRNLLRPAQMKAMGFEYHSVGRPD